MHIRTHYVFFCPFHPIKVLVTIPMFFPLLIAVNEKCWVLNWKYQSFIYFVILIHCFLHMQVNSGTDPEIIRNKLKEALPRAPEKQLVRVI